MTETLLQGNDWLTWMEQTQREERRKGLERGPHQPADSQVDLWDKTDRQLHFPERHGAPALVSEGSASKAADSNSARARWLLKHDVHTQRLDAGIGFCWFAKQGDDEPVSGETEDAAIARLARENGLPWFRAAEFRNADRGAVPRRRESDRGRST